MVVLAVLSVLAVVSVIVTVGSSMLPGADTPSPADDSQRDIPSPPPVPPPAPAPEPAPIDPMLAWCTGGTAHAMDPASTKLCHGPVHSTCTFACDPGYVPVGNHTCHAGESVRTKLRTVRQSVKP